MALQHTTNTQAQHRNIRDMHGRQVGIAYGWNKDHQEDGSHEVTAEALANAQLWAAAPDLLAAGMKAMCALSYASRYSNEFDDTYKILNAAVTKATGWNENNALLWEAAPALLDALRNIVLETMPYSPMRPYSGDSFLPEKFIQAARAALEQAGHAIHADRLAGAEDMFVTVPETTLPNGTVVPSFQVGRYLCTKGDNGRATVNATGKPWVRVNYHDARKACIDAGFKLLTELQALAIAWNISQQDANWTSGKVGEGKLHQGIRLGNVSEAQPDTYLPENLNEQRYHKLSNGEVIYDFAGNAFTWVFDDVQGDEQGLIAKPFAEDSPSITTAPYPSLEKGMGWRPDAGRDWSGNALVRGGYWGSGGNAGVFYLGSDWPDFGDDYVGFRCTK